MPNRRCVKGFPSLNLLTHTPYRRDPLTAVRGFDIWKFCSAFYLQNLWIYFGEGVSDFRLRGELSASTDI